MKVNAIAMACLPSLMFACALSAVAPAHAHVTLELREAKAGAPYKAVLKVPHGCDGSPTLKVRAQIPEGMIAVKPMPKAGWQLETVHGRYAKSYAYHGKQLSEGVKEIIWVGRLLDAHYDEFVFSAYLASDLPAGRLHVPVTQECERGETRWSDIPSEGQDANSLKYPAPSLIVLTQAIQKPSHTVKAGPLTIEAPWIRATPGGAKVAGGYLKITNAGKELDRLVGGSMEAAGRVEVHEMALDNGVMRMRHLAKGLEIKPGESIELKPGGYHLMFMDLKRGLKEGETAKGTLAFEKAGTIEVEYRVRPIGGGAPAAGGHSRH